MNKTPSKDLYIGLMSGTSMDGIDAAVVDYSNNTPNIIATRNFKTPELTRKKLLQLCDSYDDSGNCLNAALLKELDTEMAELFADAAIQLMTESTIQKDTIQAIGSHGQTVFHLPPHRDDTGSQRNGFSVQIGGPQTIANRTGIRTIGDFRNADMQVGGHGAPLAPAFHHGVFHSTESQRVIVNLGGIANITLLPISGDVIGFDTGPANVLMDLWIKKHLDKNFDENGNWARTGTVIHALLDILLSEPYLSLSPPKSTGRELFNARWLEDKLKQIENKPEAADIQRTLAEFTAVTVAQAIDDFAANTREIYLCGGGAHNTLVAELLAKKTAVSVSSTAELGVDPDWVEAAAFAWLAKRHLDNKPGNLPSVTGARQAVILGKKFLPSG